MRGDAGGKVYKRGNTNRTNIANKGVLYYIIYNVRVYAYANKGVEEVDAMRTFRKSTGMTATCRRC